MKEQLKEKTKLFGLENLEYKIEEITSWTQS